MDYLLEGHLVKGTCPFSDQIEFTVPTCLSYNEVLHLVKPVRSDEDIEMMNLTDLTYDSIVLDRSSRKAKRRDTTGPFILLLLVQSPSVS